MSSLCLAVVHFIVCGEGTRDDEWVTVEPTPVKYANLPHPGAFKVLRVPPSPQKSITPIVRIFPREARPIFVVGRDETVSLPPRLPVPKPRSRTLTPVPPTSIVAGVVSANPLPMRSRSVNHPVKSSRAQLSTNESLPIPSSSFVGIPDSKRVAFPCTGKPQRASSGLASALRTGHQSLLTVPDLGLPSTECIANPQLARVPSEVSPSGNPKKQVASKLTPSKLSSALSPGVSCPSAVPESSREPTLRTSQMTARPGLCSPATSSRPSKYKRVTSSSFLGKRGSSGQLVSPSTLSFPTYPRPNRDSLSGTSSEQNEEQSTFAPPKKSELVIAESIPLFPQVGSLQKSSSRARTSTKIYLPSKTRRVECLASPGETSPEVAVVHIATSRKSATKDPNRVNDSANISSHSMHDIKFHQLERKEKEHDAPYRKNTSRAAVFHTDSGDNSLYQADHASSKHLQNAYLADKECMTQSIGPRKTAHIETTSPSQALDGFSPTLLRDNAGQDGAVSLQQKRGRAEEDCLLPGMTMVETKRRRKTVAGYDVSPKDCQKSDHMDTPTCNNFEDPQGKTTVISMLAQPLPISCTVGMKPQSGGSRTCPIKDIEQCVTQLVSVALLSRSQNGSTKERMTKLRQQLRALFRSKSCWIRDHGNASKSDISLLNNADGANSQLRKPNVLSHFNGNINIHGEGLAKEVRSDAPNRSQHFSGMGGCKAPGTVEQSEGPVRAAQGVAGISRVLKACSTGLSPSSVSGDHSSIKVEAVRGIQFIFARWKLSLSKQERPVNHIAVEAKRIANICAALRSPAVGNVFILDADIPRYFKELDAAAHPILFLVGEMTAGMEKYVRSSVREADIQISRKEEVKTVLLALRDILEWVRILVDRMLGMYEKYKGQSDCEGANALCDDLWSSLFINNNNIIPAMRKAKKSFPCAGEVTDGRIYFNRRKRVGSEINSLTRSMKAVYVWCHAVLDCRRANRSDPTCSRESPDIRLANNTSIDILGQVDGAQTANDGFVLHTEIEGESAGLEIGDDDTVKLSDRLETAGVQESPAIPKLMEYGAVVKMGGKKAPLQKKVLWDLRRDTGASALVENEDMLQFLFEDGENLLGTEDKLQMEAVADRAAMVSRGCIHALYGWLRIHCTNLENAVLGKRRQMPGWVNLGMTPSELCELESKVTLIKLSR